MIEAALLVFFPMLVAFGAASDLLTMTIQNRVSVLLIAGFAVIAVGTGMPLSVWGTHLLGFLPVFAVGFVFFAFGWMGGGDVKFASAISLWIGLTPVLAEFMIYLSLYGAALTLALLALRQMVAVPAILIRQDWFDRLYDRNSGIPYGIAIGAAALQVYPSTEWFRLIGQNF